MIWRVIISGLILVYAVGCSTSRGFNRGGLRDGMNPATVIDDKEIENTFKIKPQLPKPFKVGIYFKEPVSHGYHSQAKWRWTDEDKQKIFSLGDELKMTGEISDVFVITTQLASGDEIKSIRYAAAQHGADAVLIVSGINDVDSYTNRWAWTYIGLVTALFVPANEVDVLFLSRASMWDVRNQFLYMTAESESIKKQTAPAAWVDEKPLIEQAKADSFVKLREEISKMIKVMLSKSKSASL